MDGVRRRSLGKSHLTTRAKRLIEPGETVWLSGDRSVKVVGLVELDDEDRYVGLLKVAPT